MVIYINRGQICLTLDTFISLNLRNREPLISQKCYNFHHSSRENNYHKTFRIRKAMLQKSASPDTSEVPEVVTAKVLKDRTCEAGPEVCFSRKL